MNSDGKQRFKTKKGENAYGLKKLRQWNKDNANPGNTALSEVQDGDEPATSHCERLRHYSFDVRHATQCVSHSQLCDGPALVVPRVFNGQCTKMSDAHWLEEQATLLGDDPNTGIFSQWRKLRDQIKKETNFDGERSQCIAMLCKYGGFKAARKLHPDMVNRQNFTEEEKLERINMFKFLNNCKDKFPALVELDGDKQLEC